MQFLTIFIVARCYCYTATATLLLLTYLHILGHKSNLYLHLSCTCTCTSQTCTCRSCRLARTSSAIWSRAECSYLQACGPGYARLCCLYYLSYRSVAYYFTPVDVIARFMWYTYACLFESHGTFSCLYIEEVDISTNCTAWNLFPFPFMLLKLDYTYLTGSQNIFQSSYLSLHIYKWFTYLPLKTSY